MWWLRARPRNWLAGIRWAVLDLSSPYRLAFEVALPHAAQVADPFHVGCLAIDALAAVGADTRTWDKTTIT